MEIRGHELALRLPADDDAEALFALASDPAVTRWFSWGPYADAGEARDWIAAQAARRAAGEQLDFVVHHRIHGPIGVTGLADLAVRDRRAVIGTWLGRAAWGTGANAEAKALVFHLAFDVCGLERLTAYTDPANVRSARALLNVGFTREGRLRRFHRHGDRRLDVEVFGLLDEEWRAGPLGRMPVAVIGALSEPWRLR
jgi:ribosomal-protein-alanine N-acetyltransferase